MQLSIKNVADVDVFANPGFVNPVIPRSGYASMGSRARDRPDVNQPQAGVRQGNLI